VAASASDIVVVTNVEAGLYFAVADAMTHDLFATQGDQSARAAAEVAAASPGTFPGGCSRAGATAGTVTFDLENCTGPLGLVHASGRVTAKIVDRGSDPGGAFLIQLSGDSVAANGAVVILNTSAVLTAAADGSKTLRAISMSNGTGPSGTWVAHTGSYTVAWALGADCATINGTFGGVGSGTYGGASETLTGYVACRGSCPQSGVATSIFEQGSLNLVYDGKPWAFCMASIGANEGLQLECP
jgi:hypothetical protein